MLNKKYSSNNLLIGASAPPTAAASSAGFSSLVRVGGNTLGSTSQRQREGIISQIKFGSDSFLSQREIGFSPKKQRSNLGITLGKIELPARLLQQKELFNEVGGWLSAHRERRLLLGMNQSQNWSSSKQRVHSSSHTLYAAASTNSSISLNQTPQELQLKKQQLSQQKKLFYEHKNIFRVKDFKLLKDRQDRIAQSVDDPISNAMRRVLLQEFETKVSLFLKIMTNKKEVSSKVTDKSFKDVTQSMNDLDTHRQFNSIYFNNTNNQMNQTSSMINNQPYQNNSLTNQINQISNQSLQPVPPYAQMSINSEENQINSQEVGKTQQQSKISEFAVRKLDSGQSSISALLGTSNNNIRSGSKQSGQRRRRWTERKQQLIKKSASESKIMEERDNYPQKVQYRTYYQINEHQFQELSEQQITTLSQEEKDQYYNVLEHFKQVGHKFKVPVATVQQTTNEESKQLNNLGGSGMAGMSESKFALHQRLQDFILEKCKNFLGSAGLEYDEKLKLMKQQYEQMLNNFDKKSFKIVLPPNVRVRGQTFNDFYIFDELQKESDSKKVEFDIEDIINDNFNILNTKVDPQQIQIQEDKTEEGNLDDEERERKKVRIKIGQDDSSEERKKNKKLTKKMTTLLSPKSTQQDKQEDLLIIEDGKKSLELNLEGDDKHKRIKIHKEQKFVQEEQQKEFNKDNSDDSGDEDRRKIKNTNKEGKILKKKSNENNQSQTQVKKEDPKDAKIQIFEPVPSQQPGNFKVQPVKQDLPKEEKKKEEKHVVIQEPKDDTKQKNQKNKKNKKKNKKELEVAAEEEKKQQQIQSNEQKPPVEAVRDEVPLLQRITSQINAEEEEKTKQNYVHFDNRVIGTGFFDTLLNCTDIFELNLIQYQFNEKKSMHVNKNIEHKTEIDKKVFEKIQQWEIEIEEDNTDYNLFQIQLADQIILTENKGNRASKPHYNYDAEFTKVSIDEEEALIQEASLSPMKKAYSAIDHLSRTQSNTSILKSQNSKQYESGSNIKINNDNISKNTLNKQNTIQDNATGKNNNYRSNYNNISNLIEAAQKKEVSSSFINTKDKGHSQTISSSDDEEKSHSSKSHKVHSFENLDHIVVPDYIPSVSDCSAFDV